MKASLLVLSGWLAVAASTAFGQVPTPQPQTGPALVAPTAPQLPEPPSLSQIAPLPSIAWTATFFHGPTLAISEISPRNPHPLSYAAGAGYTGGLGIGQFAWLGKQWDIIDVGALAIGSVVSPNGQAEGALQVGFIVGSMGNPNGVPFLSVAIITTPYTASGGGWAQGGRPGTSFGLMGAVPL